MVGAAAFTVRVATLEAAPVAACAELTPEAWLLCVPGTSLVTTTVTVQEPLRRDREAGEGEVRRTRGEVVRARAHARAGGRAGGGDRHVRQRVGEARAA